MKVIYANGPAPLVPAALKIVEKYDPALYARMQATDWTVHTFPPADVPREIIYGFILGAEAATMGNEGDVRRLAPQWVNHTFLLGTQMFTDDAKGMKVPASYLLAHTLAHEFDHLFGDESEAKAYDAGAAFVRKLPAAYSKKILPVIARTKQAALAHEGPYALTQ